MINGLAAILRLALSTLLKKSYCIASFKTIIFWSQIILVRSIWQWNFRLQMHQKILTYYRSSAMISFFYWLALRGQGLNPQYT